MLFCRLITVILALAAMHGTARTEELDSKKVDALVDRALNEWEVPGAAVVIVSDQKVLYLQGRGVREKGKPERVTPDTVFPLASCSKAFTTTLMAMLVDDEKIAWNDPARKHLKNFHLSDPLADGDVRLFDLVSHRTGVAPHDLLWYRAPWSQEEMIRRVGKLPLSKPFRTAMQYQSVMFTAAGHAAASAGGKPWDVLVQQRILGPLGMKTSSLRTTDAFKIPDRASPHRRKDDSIAVIPWYEQKEPNPAGSVNSTARDLIPWLQLHLNEGLHGEERLVSAENLSVTHTPHIVIPVTGTTRGEHPFTQQMSYAMGWVVQDYRGEKLVSHAGLIDGFRAHLTMIPKKKLALAILCNMDQTRMNLALSNDLVDLLLGAPAKDWNSHYQEIVAFAAFKAKNQMLQLARSRQRGTTPTLPLKSYPGAYEDPAYGVAKILEQNGELLLEWSSFRCKLDHFHYDTFRVDDDLLGPILEFHLDDAKRITGMSAFGVDFKRK